MAGLNPQHIKVLTLIEENMGLSTKEIAKACNFSTNYLQKLLNTHPDTGPVGQLFKTALNKTYDNISKRAKKNSKSTQDVLIKKLRRWSQELPAGKLNEKQVTKACDILNTLSKAMPKVEIGHLSITNHMSSEEMLHEYKRLTTLAKYALDGIGVSGSPKGRAGSLHQSLASRDILSEEQEADVLPSEPDTRDLPQE